MNGALPQAAHVRSDFLHSSMRPRARALLNLVLYFAFFLPGVGALLYAGWEHPGCAATPPDRKASRAPVCDAHRIRCFRTPSFSSRRRSSSRLPRYARPPPREGEFDEGQGIEAIAGNDVREAPRLRCANGELNHRHDEARCRPQHRAGRSHRRWSTDCPTCRPMSGGGGCAARRCRPGRWADSGRCS
jgi:hypothetical protein